mmetsp:Transcript_41371/g.82913  ORF Transcript_41371/g.82913 Transcript_41371/m.82913 type:complete len:236 (-) Transcript_41371:222-929(-)
MQVSREPLRLLPASAIQWVVDRGQHQIETLVLLSLVPDTFTVTYQVDDFLALICRRTLASDDATRPVSRLHASRWLKLRSFNHLDIRRLRLLGLFLCFLSLPQFNLDVRRLRFLLLFALRVRVIVVVTLAKELMEHGSYLLHSGLVFHLRCGPDFEQHRFAFVMQQLPHANLGRAEISRANLLYILRTDAHLVVGEEVQSQIQARKRSCVLVPKEPRRVPDGILTLPARRPPCRR